MMLRKWYCSLFGTYWLSFGIVCPIPRARIQQLSGCGKKRREKLKKERTKQRTSTERAEKAKKVTSLFANFRTFYGWRVAKFHQRHLGNRTVDPASLQSPLQVSHLASIFRILLEPSSENPCQGQGVSSAQKEPFLWPFLPHFLSAQRLSIPLSPTETLYFPLVFQLSLHRERK